MSVIDTVCTWIKAEAKDDSHGYSQDSNKRWGNPDYDCSSLVITAWQKAGVPVKEAGASYTGNMLSAFKKCGFVVYGWSRSLALKKGDVLLTPNRHTAQYIGDGRIVHARGAENGTKYGKDGDQTGREILETGYYIPSYEWSYVLRYTGEEGRDTVEVTMEVLRKGDKGNQVSLLQLLLNEKGFVGKNGRALEIDKSFGANTEYAVKAFQKSHGLEQDGVVGHKTWQVLTSISYA